jgi:hypothetical protein
MNRRITFLIGLLSISLTGTAFAGWNDYKPATLSDIVAKHAKYLSKRKVPKGAVATNLHYKGDPFRSTVLFLGKVRNINPGHRSFIKMWGESSKKDTAKLAKTYKNEILVREGKKSYWLPIQKILVSHFKRDVKKNGEVMLFMVYVGTIGKNPIFLVEEFRAF